MEETSIISTAPWKIIPFAWERRSLLMEISTESRQEVKSGPSILGPARTGLFCPSGVLSAELTGAERSWKGVQMKPCKPDVDLYPGIQHPWSYMGQGELEGTVRCLSQLTRPEPGQTLQVCFTTSRWSIHSPGLVPCLDRMPAPLFRCLGIWIVLSERSLPWDHPRIWCASMCWCAPTYGDLLILGESV